ncbi:MAG: GNAT family N-acetyltransferase [Muribaculaceae bacterium]|nr:GNAT family N-acetyltransferase [Muribaculaceae bacterium]
MKVTIRPLKIDDAYTSVKWRNDKEVFKYTGTVYAEEITIESELRWIQNVIHRENEYRCAIIADGKYVGNIYLTDIDTTGGTYHIFLGNKDYWGKGVAKKASLLMLDYAFNVLELSVVKLRVRKANISAIKLYLSLNFTKVSEDDEFIIYEKRPSIYRMF